MMIVIDMMLMKIVVIGVVDDSVNDSIDSDDSDDAIVLLNYRI